LSVEVPGVPLGGKIECECGKVHEVPIKEVLIKRAAIEEIPKVYDKLSLKEIACVVHDEITKQITGDKIVEILEAKGIKTIEVVVTGPLEEEVNRVGDIAKRQNCRCIIAVGGGSVIDVGKLAAHRIGVSFISVPTALSHDGIASATASIISVDNIKKSFKATPPVAVIFDIHVLENAPKRMTISGCGDLLAKATSLKDWELGKNEVGEYYCPFTAKLALSTYFETMSFIKDKDKLISKLASTMFKSSLAMTLVGSSRPNSGSEHLFAHYLDMHFKTYGMHGELVGIGTILLSKYHNEYNINWWDKEEFQWYTIKSALSSIGFPSSLSKLGINREMAAEALSRGHIIRPERYTILHKRPISFDEALNLLYEVFAI